MFSTVLELIEELKNGKMIILVDNEDRENEGDFVMSAHHISKESINFMVKNGRGLVCMPISEKRARQLNLNLMVQNNDSQFSTNFTVSIEAAQGVTTGISAQDRALTIKAASNENAKPLDIVQPGHIFPIIAKEGGVLTRAGHTEASTDFTKLANLGDSAVIVEILNEDGSMARRNDLEKIAKKHNLKIGTIADLIKYRIENEKTVEKVSSIEIDTVYGKFNLHSYFDKISKKIHFALVKGKINKNDSIYVRVHYQDSLIDIFKIKELQRSWDLHSAMEFIAKKENGIIVILSNFEETNSLQNRFEELHKMLKKNTNIKNTDNKVIGAGARILKDLGVHKMKVLGSNQKITALSGFDLEITDYLSNNK